MAELTGEQQFELQAEEAWNALVDVDPTYQRLVEADAEVMDLSMHCFKIGYAKGYVAANEEAEA